MRKKTVSAKRQAVLAHARAQIEEAGRSVLDAHETLVAEELISRGAMDHEKAREGVTSLVESLKEAFEADEQIVEAMDRALAILDPSFEMPDDEEPPSIELLADRHLVLDCDLKHDKVNDPAHDSIYGELIDAELVLTVYEWNWPAIRDHVQRQVDEARADEDVVPELRVPVQVQIRTEWTEWKNGERFRRTCDLVPLLTEKVATAVDPDPNDDLQRIYGGEEDGGNEESEES